MTESKIIIDENVSGGSKPDEGHSKDCVQNNLLCQQFAEILQSSILPSPTGVCTVTRTRNIPAVIAGRLTRSPLALNALFSFESADLLGNTLNLGETVILQEEINPFISALRAQNIVVTAFHNHWLFEEPRLMFIHFFSIEAPLSFATKVAAAFKVLLPF